MSAMCKISAIHLPSTVNGHIRLPREVLLDQPVPSYWTTQVQNGSKNVLIYKFAGYIVKK